MKKIYTSIAALSILTTHIHAAGIAYLHSIQAALHAYEGQGYSDSEWAGRNPPNSENEAGEPTYEQNEDPDGPCYDYKTSQQVWEDDENYYILNDDGSITTLGK